LLVHAPNVTRVAPAALPRRPVIGPPSKGEPLMSAARTLAAVLLVLLSVAPAQAARPIVDLHKFDAYFALFAADSNVPWKSTTVRLDTYSSAPVDFSVYRVDPADVLSAGSNARSRAVDTRRLRPLLQFTFSPPGGYQFQPNDVNVPLGNAEGFFVVEARRGNVGEQVWINRTRIGLIVKQTPAQMFVSGVDLGTGSPVAGMRVELLVGERFVTKYTGSDGTLRYEGDERPQFVLAQWGGSYAFLSVLPQAPVPSTIVGVRTASAVVHAGGVIRVVGFARMRRGDTLAAASGDAAVTLRQGPRVLAQARVPVDRSGAFTTELTVPSNASAGDDAILAQIGDGVGGATIHVDADAGGLTLDVASACGDDCDHDADIPVIVRASRGGVEVHVSVIRSPHVYVGYVPETTPWGTTTWLDERITTDADGRAEVDIPHPTDGLASTYGVRVESGGATADTRIVVPTAPVTLRVHVDSDEQQLGTPIGVDVYANDVLSGLPASGPVTVTLAHGGSMQQQTLDLDASGHARATFANADLGTNLVTATIDERRHQAEDATQLEVVAQATSGVLEDNSADVTVSVDRGTYRPGDPIVVDADASGSAGEALFTLEGALGVQSVLARVVNGHARATLRAVEAPGALQVSVAFVRDGAIESNSIGLDVDAAGRAESATISVAPSPQPGGNVEVSLDGVRGGEGTVAMRLTLGDPSGSAQFTSAPDLLAFGVSTTQTSAPQSTTWHPWVDSTGDHPLVLEFVRHTEPPPDLTIEEADTHAITWSVTRSDGTPLALQLPEQPGRYTLSVLDIAADGRLIVASSVLVVP
jgi:uncharacterized protein YfaS (alpha-2-macroglobulin family)